MPGSRSIPGTLGEEATIDPYQSSQPHQPDSSRPSIPRSGGAVPFRPADQDHLSAGPPGPPRDEDYGQPVPGPLPEPAIPLRPAPAPAPADWADESWLVEWPEEKGQPGRREPQRPVARRSPQVESGQRSQGQNSRPRSDSVDEPSAPQARHLSRIIIAVKDPAALACFYQAAFGFQLHGRLRRRQIELDGQAIQLVLQAGGPDPETAPRSRVKLVFAVKDVTKARKNLLRLGARMGRAQVFGAIEVCEGLDPEGNPFQVSTRGTH